MKKLFVMFVAILTAHIMQPAWAQDDEPQGRDLSVISSCSQAVPRYVNCGGPSWPVPDNILTDEWDIVNTLCWYKNQPPGTCLCNNPITLFF
jgi:hypothetical protein